jgi:hypothetical protein
MATVTDLSDRELRKELTKQRKRAEAIDKLDAAKVVGSGRADATLAELADAGDAIKRLSAERDRRERAKQGDSILQGIRQARAIREQDDARAAQKTERAAALEGLHLRTPPRGPHYVAARLTQSEGEQLLALAQRWDEAGTLPAKDEARWEQLVCKAGDDPHIFEREREEKALRQTEERLRDQARQDSLRQRPAAPPGTALLPGFLAAWVTDRSEGGLDVERLGILAAVLLGLENRVPTVAGSRIEDGPDGEPVMVGATDPLRVDPRDGSLTTQEAFSFLFENRLLRRERVDGELCITAGERIRNLYAPKEGARDG